jgi:type 1 glutamine amidotransferase
MRPLLAILAVFTLSLFANLRIASAEESRPRKIVLIAGKKSHGPGAHDYERTMRLFKAMLDRSNIAAQIVTEVHENGWPADPTTLENADTIVFYSDGRDGDKFVDVPFVEAARMALIEKQIARGCGFFTMHFSTFVTKKEGEKVLDWTGGYFEWEGPNGEKKWYSRISQGKTLELATPAHPISRGVAQTVPANDEIYWRMRFRENDPRWTPIWKVPDYVDAQTPNANVVAWAFEHTQETGGARGFGTSVGHSYRLWQDDNIRKLFLNAIAWTAHVDIPANGIESKFLTDEEVATALTQTPQK